MKCECGTYLKFQGVQIPDQPDVAKYGELVIDLLFKCPKCKQGYKNVQVWDLEPPADGTFLEPYELPEAQFFPVFYIERDDIRTALGKTDEELPDSMLTEAIMERIAQRFGAFGSLMREMNPETAHIAREIMGVVHKTGQLTETQEKQLAFIDKIEPYESLNKLRTYHITCNTCKISKVFHAADSCRSFINQHEGHYTWLQHEGAKDPLEVDKSA